MAERGLPLPKFGEWDVNDPTSVEGFTVIFNKARNEKRTGGKSESPPKDESTYNKHGSTLGKPSHSVAILAELKLSNTTSDQLLMFKRSAILSLLFLFIN